MIEQSLSEARRSFCQTLRALSSSGDEHVVVVHKRGEPIAAILSAAEAHRYFAWNAAQLREQRRQEARRELLDGLPELEDYLKQCRAQRVSRQAVVDTLLKEYDLHPSLAERVVDLVYGEEAQDQ